MTAGTAAIWSAAAFALLALVASVSERHADYAGGLFAIATTMCGVALGLLVNAFIGEDFAVRAVASHSALGLALPHRVPAVWGNPAGAALSAALVTGIAGLVVSRVTRTGAVVPAYAAFMCSLLSIAVMRSPLATLGFVPADGLGASLILQQPTFLISIVATLILAAVAPWSLSGAVAPGAAAIERSHWRISIVTLVAAGFTVLTWWYAGVASGLSRARSPLALQGGACALLIVSLAMSVRMLYVAPPRTLRPSTRTAGVAVSVVAIALLLAAPGN